MLRKFMVLIIAALIVACAGSKTGASEKSDNPEVVAYQQEWAAALSEAEALFKQLEQVQGPTTVETVLEPLNDLGILLYNGAAKAGLLSNVHPDIDMRTAGEAAEQAFSKLGTEIGLSRPIYDAVAAVDVSGEDADTQRMVALTLRDFRRSGVDQDEATRQKIRELKEELVKIGQEFGKNIREDVRSVKLDTVDELAGLPQDYIDAHQPGEDGKITITTNYPDLYPFMTYAHSDQRRKELNTVSLQRAYPENAAVLQRMVAKRHELANLLGYETWAHYITENKMIKTSVAAQEFIDKVTAVIRPAVKRETATYVERLKETNPDADGIGVWQRFYIKEMLKREKYDYDSQETRQYFAYDKVRDGILNLTGQLFGVTYKPIDAAVWHPSVESYELWDGDQLIGRFHLDMHPRDGKYKHAAAFPIQPGIHDRQIPEAALVCNFPGGGDGPGLMVHNQVETFLHEFGHLLHGLFGGNQRWVDFSGVATEWDFVEAPSQMLEEWAWDAAALQSFATNEAGETIPDDLIARMRASRDFGQALHVQRQLALSALSLNLYNRDPDDLDISQLVQETQNRYNPYEYMDDVCRVCNFGHLDGYSAIYYTYMWSLVIAKDLFSEFEKEGMMNPEIALRYRQTILEPGGSKPAAQLVRDFLGRDYTFEAFGDWLGGK